MEELNDACLFQLKAVTIDIFARNRRNNKQCRENPENFRNPIIFTVDLLQ